MKQDAFWANDPVAAPARPQSAPAPTRAPASTQFWANDPVAAPAAPRRAPTGGGRQAAPVNVPPSEPIGSGALTLEDSVRAKMDQGYSAADALRLSQEQEQYDAVRPYTLPDGRVVNLRGPGTPVAMAGTQRPDDIVVDGMLYRPTEYEPAVELPAAEVQGGVERLPMQGDVPQGSLLDQAIAGARRNPVLGTIMGLGVGGAAGVNDILGGAVRLGGNAMSYIPGMGDLGRGISQNANEFLAAVNQRVDAERGNAGLGGAVETGRLAGQVLAPMPVVGAAGGALTQGGRVLSAVPGLEGAGASIMRVGQALPAGGMLPRATPVGAAAPSRLAQAGYLGENMLAGAGNALISTAPLADQNAGVNAVIGALMPVAARPATAAVGWATDMYRRAVNEYGTKNAADIVRRALGIDYEVALSALRNAPEGVTAQQALAEAGVPADVFMAVGEAGRAADPRAFRVISDAQEAARQARLTPAQGAVQAAEMAGEANLARVQQQQFRTTQAGEQMVGEAQGAARAVPREGAAALEDLRVGAEEAAGFYTAGRAQAQRAIDEMAGGANLTAARTSEAAAKQALRAATAPMREELLAAADASGALTVAPISARLMQMADAPGVGTTNSRVLARVASELDAMAARRGGVPSAEDIYAFRKDDLDDIITSALSTGRGGEITSQAARRGQTVREVQQMVDKQLEDAIRAAGGPEWQSYLDTYSAGMRALERQEMMGAAAWMLRQNPASFQNLLRGESPDAVAGIFGRGRIDLADVLEPDQLAALKNAASVLDQEADVAGRFASQTAETTRGTARAKTEADIALEAARARAAQEAAAVNAMAGDVGAQNALAIARAQGDLAAVESVNAGELSRDQRIRAMASQGATAARELLSPGRALFGRTRTAAAFGNPSMGLALDLGAMLLDAKVSQQTRRALAQAYQSGASMAELIAITPVSERDIISRILADPRFYGAASRGAVPAAAGVINSMGGQPANTMSPAPQ